MANNLGANSSFEGQQKMRRSPLVLYSLALLLVGSTLA